MEEKKLKNATFIFLGSALIVSGILIALNYFYFSRVLPVDGLANPVNAKLLNNQKEFERIQKVLSENEQYKELTKIGAWPMKPENIETGKANPFIIK